MKRWTTKEELAWLTERIPEWHKRRGPNAVGDWLTTTTNSFIADFPLRKSLEHDEIYAVSQLRPLVGTSFH